MDLLRSQGINASYSESTTFRIGSSDDKHFVYDTTKKRTYHTILGIAEPLTPVSLQQTASRFQGGGNPNSVGFQNHVINIYDGNYYDATCGAGPYECSNDGFLQYLRENCAIRVGLTTYSGDDLFLNDFMLGVP